MALELNLGALIQDIIMLFIVIDPITLGIYVGTNTAGLEPSLRKEIILRGVTGGTVILLFFGLVGDYVMSYFGIEIEDFMIALGILLMIVAILDFMDIRYTSELRRDRASLVPIATPLIAGPAAISTTIYIKYTHGITYALIAIAVNIFLTYISMLGGAKLSEVLGKSGSQLVDKVIALILAGLAVSLIRRGIIMIVASLK